MIIEINNKEFSFIVNGLLELSREFEKKAKSKKTEKWRKESLISVKKDIDKLVNDLSIRNKK